MIGVIPPSKSVRGMSIFDNWKWPFAFEPAIAYAPFFAAYVCAPRAAIAIRPVCATAARPAAWVGALSTQLSTLNPHPLLRLEHPQITCPLKRNLSPSGKYAH